MPWLASHRTTIVPSAVRWDSVTAVIVANVAKGVTHVCDAVSSALMPTRRPIHSGVRHGTAFDVRDGDGVDVICSNMAASSLEERVNDLGVRAGLLALGSSYSPRLPSLAASDSCGFRPRSQ